MPLLYVLNYNIRAASPGEAFDVGPEEFDIT